MKERTQYYIIAAVIVVLAVGVACIRPRQTIAPTKNQPAAANTNTSGLTANTNATTNTTVVVGTTRFFTDDLPDAGPYYRFSGLIPSAWVGTYQEVDRSIEFYDPKTKTPAQRPLAILVKYYVAKDFARAPDGVKVVTRTVDGQAARSYTLTIDATMEERAAWKLGETYQRLDVLAQKGVNNTYYSFSKGPSISDTVFTTFLNSLDVQDILQSQ